MWAKNVFFSRFIARTFQEKNMQLHVLTSTTNFIMFQKMTTMLLANYYTMLLDLGIFVSTYSNRRSCFQVPRFQALGTLILFTGFIRGLKDLDVFICYVLIYLKFVNFQFWIFVARVTNQMNITYSQIQLCTL